MATRYRILSTKDVPSVVLPAQFAVDINRQGFLNTTQTSISFATTTFTLTDAGSGWSYYRAGVKYTISGNKTVALSAATAGIYYIYIDATDGTLTCSAVNNPWTLLDTKVPVATVTYNSTLTPTFWLADERHTALIDQRMEYYLHATSATKLVSTPALSGYTANSDTNATKTFAISAGTLLDQDLKFDVASLTQPDGTATDYSVWYRTAASTWAWKASNMPFVYNVGNTNDRIQYDNAGTMTDSADTNRWYNSYLLITNKSGVARHIIVPGRGSFTSLALAQAESVQSFTWVGFEVDEAVIAYRLTWATRTAGRTSQGQCVLAATPQLVNISSTTNASSGAGTDHNTLSNLQGGTTSEYYHMTSAEYTGTGTGNFVRETSPTLVTPALGTPASGVVTNLTGTASININGTVGATTPTTASVTTLTTSGGIELGNASDTTLARVSAGVVSIEGVTIPTISSTSTLTNKRTNPRLVTAASYTTDTGTSLDISACDQFEVTAQAGALKLNNPSGTPVGGNRLIVRIKDDGTARALTYDTQFRAMGTALPSTTVLSKTLYLGFIYNATDTKWDLVAAAQEA